MSPFFAFDVQFTGRVYVAASNVTGDRRAEVIVGAGAGCGPQLAVLDGRDARLLNHFFAYDPADIGGALVTAVDLDKDGRAEIVTGLSPQLTNLRAFDAKSSQRIDQFFVGNPLFNAGVFEGVSR